MQYQVPQFIEIEDKIFGPLTFKQFVYVAGGGAICFFAYRLLPFFLAVLLIIPIGGFSVALAFYKVNKRPFIDVVESAIRYTLGSKLYLWKKGPRSPEEKTIEAIAKENVGVLVPKLSNSRLKDLTWSLDINETIYSKDSGFKSREQLHPNDEISSFKGLRTDLGSGK